MKKLIIVLIWMLLYGGAGAQSKPVLRTLADIRGLDPEEAAQNVPVLVEGQVIRKHMNNGLFIFDGQVGVYVARAGDGAKLETIRLGDRVRIHGYSSAGGFTPSIRLDELTVVGHGPLPAARPFDSSELYSPSIDCDWVSVSGRLISIKRVKVITSMIQIELEQDNLRYYVQIADTPGIFEKLSGKILKQVSFNAVVGTLYNKQRQVGGRVFFVNSAEDFHLLAEYVPEIAQTMVPIHELMRLHFDPTQPVVTQGIVTSVQDRELTLRGERSSIMASVLSTPAVEVGDRVLLEGFVWPQPISPAFRAYRVQIEQKGASLPAAVPMKIEPELHSDYNYDLVQLDAEVVELERALDPLLTGKLEMLLCRAGGKLVEVRLPAGQSVSSAITPGSKVQLTGICHLLQHEEEHWRVLADRFYLQLRTVDDLILVDAAPWWTPRRMLGLVAVVVSFAALCLCWIVLLRKTVSRQTRVIARQIEQVAVTDERQRIARELHDQLDQGLVGATLQVRSGKRLLELKLIQGLRHLQQTLASKGGSPLYEQLSELEQCAENSCQALEMAQGMLNHCCNESRTSIIDLRGGLLERMDLPAAVNETLQSLAEECGATADMKVEGSPRRLKREAERNLLLIVREAVTNAVRHAAPTHLDVVLVYAENLIELTVRDNGSGFEQDQSVPEGRFGLQGMYERAAQLNGILTIKSSLQSGTRVELKLPDGKLLEFE